MDVVEQVYLISKNLPADEKYGLRSQLRRASYSVPCNIAEGYGRGTRRDYAHFVSIARGSVMELQVLLLITQRLRLLAPAQLQPAFSNLKDIERMLTRLRMKLTAITHAPSEGNIDP
jgi:four helix bundle protein